MNNGWTNIDENLFINGQWRKSSDGRTFDVIDPATEAVIGSAADATVEDGLDAVAAAAAAGPLWAAKSPRERGEILRRAFELILGKKEYLARLITMESGKAYSEACGEVVYAAEFLRWYAEEAVRILGEISTAPGGANKIIVIRQPIGVAVFVTPWNFPAAMATRKIGPALAAGCTVVLKPAKETPLTALALARLFVEAGVPPGVVNVVTTRRTSHVMSAIFADRRVRKFSFTGSTETGRLLLKQAADQVIKCSMELGGNAPFIVFKDADLDVAVASAMVAKMRNGGESCTAANRFYVERPIAEEFSHRFSVAMGELTLGHGLDEGVDVGPLVNASTRDKVASLVERAVAEGARVLTGGRAPKRRGYFYEPTVLVDIPADAHILTQEIFGPVAPIVAFDTEEEAVAHANACEFGLVSFVHSRDLGRALRVAERLESGMVGINRGVVSDPAAPFGGWKQSGVGREGAHDGLMEYLESKYIAAAW